MSILINMDMPKEGTVFVIDSAGQVWSNEWPTRGYIQLDGVTAVPVPPHGDLIDRDALPWEKQGLMLTDPDEWGIEARDIYAAPTIIPASGGKVNE